MSMNIWVIGFLGGVRVCSCIGFIQYEKVCTTTMQNGKGKRNGAVKVLTYNKKSTCK